jgi:hypothetical protein
MASVISCKVLAAPEGWYFETGGTCSAYYATMRAAFDAAVADARRLRAEGHRVQIYVSRDAGAAAHEPPHWMTPSPAVGRG